MKHGDGSHASFFMNQKVVVNLLHLGDRHQVQIYYGDRHRIGQKEQFLFIIRDIHHF